jgi:hypothetical protein
LNGDGKGIRKENRCKEGQGEFSHERKIKRGEEAIIPKEDLIQPINSRFNPQGTTKTMNYLVTLWHHSGVTKM